MAKPKREGNNLAGGILHIDKFGNIITNIPAEMLTHNWKGSEGLVVRLELVKGSQAESPELEGLDIVYLKTYEEAEKGEALCLKGSLGFLEISIREGSAAAWLEASVGDGILLTAVSET
jgi:S-adenosylmethionine hydrolase